MGRESLSALLATGDRPGVMRAWPSGFLHIVRGYAADCGRTGGWTSDYPPGTKRCPRCAALYAAASLLGDDQHGGES